MAVARKLAFKNLELPAAKTADFIVTDCSSCASFLKKYPQLFDADDPRKSAALETAAKIRDMVEFTADLELPETNSAPNIRVTYHDPCHASRGQKLSREPREILNTMQGVTYVELPEADWCCGGAGAYAFSHHVMAGRVLDRKMENVKKTAADLVLTSCPACMIHLSHGVRRHGLSTRVGHISQIVNGL